MIFHLVHTMMLIERDLIVRYNINRKKHELEHQVETLEHDCSSVKQLMQSHQREIESHQSTISRMQVKTEGDGGRGHR